MNQDYKPFVLPICVDLDHTLISTDIIWEQILELLKRNPLIFFVIIIWFLRGKKFLKNKLTEKVEIDPNQLPFRQSVIDFILEKKRNGAKAYLVTATNEIVARRINNFLGLFDEVYGSTSQVNLRGKYKAKLLEEKFGRFGFEYLGDSKKDLPIWKISARNYLVTPSKNLERRVAKIPNFGGLVGITSIGISRYFQLIRIHQWVKNFLLFLPPLLAHKLFPGIYLISILSFISFSFVASAIYILNDFFDLKSDRVHPYKRNRPIPSGSVDLTTALIISVLLMTIGISLSIFISWNFFAIIFIYILLNFFYSSIFKSVPLLDIFVLSIFYAIRIYAGGIATSVPVSNWLIAFSIFFFFSLSALKRFSEMDLQLNLKESHNFARPYNQQHTNFILVFGITSAFSSVVIFMLYINSPIVVNYYRHPSFLWIEAFLLLYWLLNAWNNAINGGIKSDPIIFLLKEKVSLLVIIFIIIFWLFASFGL